MKRRTLLFAFFVILCIPYYIENKILLLVAPAIKSDEVIFFDMAQNVSEFGRPITFLYGRQIAHNDKGTNEYPPLYFYLLNSWMKIFGQTIYAIRLFSWVIGLLVLFFFYCLLMQLRLGALLSGLGVFILSMDPNFGFASRLGRMEIVILFFLISGLFYFVRYQTHLNKWLLTIAFFSISSILTHPIGIIIPAIFGLSILTAKKSPFTKTCSFILLVSISGVGILLWLFSIYPFWESAFSIFSYQSEKKVQSIPYILYLWKSGFIYQLDIFLRSVIAITMWLFIIKSRSHKTLLVWLISSIFLSIFTKEQPYFVFISPLLVLSLIFLLRESIKNKTRIPIIGMGIMTFLVTLINGFQLFQTIYYASGTNYFLFSSQIGKYVTPKKTVCLSNNPDPYFFLKKHRTDLVLYEFLSFPLPFANIRSFLDSCDFVVLNNISNGDEIRKFILSYLEINKQNVFILSQNTYQETYIFELSNKQRRL